MAERQYDGVAIIGVAGRFPGAENVEEFWQNLVSGKESISFFTDAELAESGLEVESLRRRGQYVAARGVLKDADCFDAAFFGIHPKEAEVLDPQQRVFLETCWNALERAGYGPDQVGGSTGVFGGATYNTYFRQVLQSHPDLIEMVGPDLVMYGNEKDYLTTRVAYKLGLRGPAINVSTACSTSLVAVSQACQSLMTYQCDLALAGGVSVTVPQKRGYFYDEGNIGSFDGHTRTFDAKAAGTVFSNGVAVVVLKRLEDAVKGGDQIYAVIRGAALNNDGSQRVSFGAPGVEGQSEVIAMAHALAEVDPDTITYVEAHGTATPLGDPIELAGLTKAFRLGTSANQFCAIGSVKSSIGHLDVASGVAGLIKTALALHHKLIPASLHFTSPNPKLDLENSPFYVNASLQEWKANSDFPRRAGVSSFGTGGTNAHVVLEEAPELPPSGPSRPWQLLPLSAKTPEALNRMTANTAEYLKELAQKSGDVAAQLADAAFTLQTGRSQFAHRRIVACDSAQSGAEALRSLDASRVFSQQQQLREPPVVFMFPGQGAQYAGMGSELYRVEPVFRAEVDRCSEILKKHLHLDLRTVIFPLRGAEKNAEELLVQTKYTQPALFTIEYALAQLWMSWGIRPAAMVGHSVGEYVAGCLAGVFALDEALSLVARRAEMVQALPTGAMLAVRLSEKDVLPHLVENIAIAAVNSANLCVVSGPHDAIRDLEQRLAQKNIVTRHLRTSHAFHSQMMEPVLAPFAELVGQVTLREPQIPYISNVTGKWITAEQAKDPKYWAGHVRDTVRFSDSVQELAKDSRYIILEVGPGQTLSTLARQHQSKSSDQIVLATLPYVGEQEPRGPIESLGRLWMAGVEIDWKAFYAGETRHRVVAPTYPFEKTRHWPESAGRAVAEPQTSPEPTVSPDGPITTELVQNVVEETTVEEEPVQVTENSEPDLPRKDRIMVAVRSVLERVSGIPLADVDPGAGFLELGLDSLLLTQVGTTMQNEFGVRVSFRQLMEELSSIDSLASHLDGVLPPESFAPPPARLPVSKPASARPSQATASTMPSGSANISIPNPTVAQGPLAELLAQQQELTNRLMAMLSQTPGTTPAIPKPGVIVSPPVSTAAVAKPEQKPFGPFKAIENKASAALTPLQQEFLDKFIKRYTERTAKSKKHTQTYRRFLADPRTMAGFRPYWKEMVYPIVIEKSLGARLWDIDGNEFLDFTMGFGTNILGHSLPAITDAIEEQLHKGVEVCPQTPLAGRVAELMCELTHMERCAFCNTGSEAVLAAVRVARTVTGRQLIVYFGGDYHGIFDEVLQRAAGTPDDQRLMPVAPGIPGQSSKNVLILDYDSPASIEVIRKRGAEIAAVLVEPIQSRRPDVQPKEFLQQLRAVTRETGSALIFDEIITGFRAHQGGVQALYNIQADLATYGKIIGGGMPMGAVCGSAKFLDALDGGFWQYGDSSVPEAGVTFFAGTYVRHPLAMAGAAATLEHLKREGPGLQAGLNTRMTEIVKELNEFLTSVHADVHVEHFGSFCWVRLEPKLKYANILFFLLRDKGIHIFEGRLFFLSTAHTDADIRQFILAFKECIREMQEIGFLPGQPGVSDQPSNVIDVTSASNQLRKNVSETVQVGAVAAKMVSPAKSTRPAVRATGPMKFGMYFFGNYPAPYSPDKYRMIIESAKYADSQGFSALWLPERHFHAVGGFSPNPAVVAAALARETRQIHLRAGSVVLPLHNPIRVAEEWSVVDNLSNGRVGISIASGWHPNDFVFAPDAYERRRELCTEGLEIIRKLWSGQEIPARGGTGNSLMVSLYPMPVQAELPAWLTCVQAPSYEKAGELGIGVLAMLTNQTMEEVADKIALYRESLVRHGHDPAKGNVTMLVHTFVGEHSEATINKARGPMREYLRSYLDNSQKRHDSTSGAQSLDKEDLEYLLDRSFNDYIKGKALIGTPANCAAVIEGLRNIGVDEVGCFVDFGVDAESVLKSLPQLGELKRLCDSTATTNGSPSGNSSITVSASEPGTLPLTESQQGLWLLAKMAHAGNRAYMEATTLRLRGPLNLELLQKSLQILVDRHEGLRTTVDAAGETQNIHPHLDLAVDLIDVTSVPADVRASKLAAHFAEFESETLDLSQGPMVRARVFRTDAQEHLLVLMFHHIFGNGPSYEVFFSELAKTYDALVNGKSPALEPAMQLSEYVQWRHQQIGTPDFEQDKTYWLNRFSDAMPVLDLPADHARPVVMTYRGGRRSLILGAALTQNLRAASRKLRASLFMTLFSGFNVLLHRLSGQDDIIVGVPFEGVVRTLPTGKHLFANTTNMVPLRSRINSAATFEEFLAATKSLILESNEHQSYFLGRMIQDLKLRPDPSRPPIVAASFNLESGAFKAVSGNVNIDFLLENVPFANPTDASKFELTVNIADMQDVLRIDCDYSADLFDAATVDRWLKHYETLLEGIVANSKNTLSALPILSDSERSELAASQSAVEKDYSGQETLVAMFETMVARTPNARAVSLDGVHLTYDELNRRANQLAHYLKKLNVGPEVLVGLFTSRSIEMVVGILGILKAGGAYLPIDPVYPKERLTFMMEDARAPVLLTESKLSSELDAKAATVVLLDSDASAIATEPDSNPSSSATADNLAYVIYTSGSTGKPKGTMVTHRNVARLMRATESWYGFGQNDVWTLFHSHAFDFSVWELWGALAYGGRLVIVPYLTSRSPEDFFALLVNERVTVLNQTPSAFLQLMQADERAGADQKLALRYVIFGGEALDINNLRPWFERHGDQKPQLVNMYGITETTVHVTYRPLSAADLESGSVVGVPIPDLQVHLLDPSGQPVPVGVTGEIYVGGAGVARGYLNRDELTRERFIPDPFSNRPGAKLYRSGDTARHLPNRDIEYFGRIDRQVKLRGFRIELGEIEAVLSRNPFVRQCVVIAREDASGEKRLVAYFEPNSGSSANTQSLRDQMKRELPDYMIPSAFVSVDKMPLTPNGKIDLRNLPSELSAEKRDGFVAPKDSLEQMLAQIWAKVLKVKRVGSTDNFFDLGGHSLLAVRVIVEIERLHKRRLPLATLLQFPTVGGLADTLRKEHWEPKWTSLVPLRAGGARPPFFLMHSHGGNVLEYRPLANHLDPDQPVYALQARGLDGKIIKGRSIEDIAADYLAEIRSLQPEGPYYLGGFCFGGLVALDAARQLTEAGEKVGLVVLLQTNHPASEHFNPDSSFVNRWYHRSAKRIDLERENMSYRGVGYIRDRARFVWDMAGARASIAYHNRVGNGDSKPNGGNGHKNLSMSHILELLAIEHDKAFAKYIPRPYYGDVVLFRASKQLPGLELDPVLGWKDTMMGNFDICEVPGHQQNILIEPNLLRLVKELASRLEAAQQKNNAEVKEQLTTVRR